MARFCGITILAALFVFGAKAQADEGAAICAKAATQAEKKHALPEGVLAAISIVETTKTKLEDAITVAEHIRKAVMNKELIKKSSGQKLGRVTMSFGIAQFKPDDTVESLIARSDKLLYAAKHAGRNNVQTELNQQADQEEMAKNGTAA